MVYVGPDRHGTVPDAQASLLRRIGEFMRTYGDSVYGTRGGPWQPVDGKYGFTHRDRTIYVHLLRGYSGTGFTTPSLGDAKVEKVFDVATGTTLSYASAPDGTVTVEGVNRSRHAEDSVVGIRLDRPVCQRDLAVHRRATASSAAEDNSAALAVDGSTSTYWLAGESGPDQWLTVDLGAAKPLTGVRVVWKKADTNYRYRLEGSTDESNWTTLADLTMTAGTTTRATPGPVTCTYHDETTSICPHAKDGFSRSS
ncbi:discoidin domain-containing protein [Streptomyces sp. NPDC020490]|uniref:discoidin domain-containing protein n=1 Tax=Streptomyces sp. NPDC020490 TaxID=3365078 RepID=UPI0037B2EE66